MIISDEQVRLVVEYLHTPDTYSAQCPTVVCENASEDLMTLIVHELEHVPDVRADRVAQAREMLANSIPASDLVASKLIGRVLSDSIR